MSITVHSTVLEWKAWPVGDSKLKFHQNLWFQKPAPLGPPDGVLDAPDEVLRGVSVHPPPLGAPGASPVHNVYVVGHVLGGGKPGHLQAQQIFTSTLSYSLTVSPDMSLCRQFFQNFTKVCIPKFTCIFEIGLEEDLPAFICQHLFALQQTQVCRLFSCSGNL